MSDIITEAVAALREKIDGEFDGSAKFEIEGEGSVVVDGAGVREGSDGDDEREDARDTRKDRAEKGNTDAVTVCNGHGKRRRW